MRDLLILFVHAVTTLLRIVPPGGVRAVVAESCLAKHQLLILNLSRRRAPNLRILDRVIAGFCSLWIQPRRLARVAIAFRPSTLLNFHRALAIHKYRLLFSPKQRMKPGPKGPTAELIRTILEMKQRNPRWGCPQIAYQINLAFGTSIKTSINKDIVRRIFATHPPQRGSDSPSWLTFFGHAKDDEHRTHAGLNGQLPDSRSPAPMSLASSNGRSTVVGFIKRPLPHERTNSQANVIL